MSGDENGVGKNAVDGLLEAKKGRFVALGTIERRARTEEEKTSGCEAEM
jgi:hypothetical protein